MSATRKYVAAKGERAKIVCRCSVCRLRALWSFDGETLLAFSHWLRLVLSIINYCLFNDESYSATQAWRAKRDDTPMSMRASFGWLLRSTHIRTLMGGIRIKRVVCSLYDALHGEYDGICHGITYYIERRHQAVIDSCILSVLSPRLIILPTCRITNYSHCVHVVIALTELRMAGHRRLLFGYATAMRRYFYETSVKWQVSHKTCRGYRDFRHYCYDEWLRRR